LTNQRCQCNEKDRGPQTRVGHVGHEEIGYVGDGDHGESGNESGICCAACEEGCVVGFCFCEGCDCVWGCGYGCHFSCEEESDCENGCERHDVRGSAWGCALGSQAALLRLGRRHRLKT